jgi:predicted pyridoxine 5'-phosphate oxidase superfamily flavin-nucleotide-binding protein
MPSRALMAEPGLYRVEALFPDAFLHLAEVCLRWCLASVAEDPSQVGLSPEPFCQVLHVRDLEHIPEPAKALKEHKRISIYAIFKGLLESNLSVNIENKLNHGRAKQISKEKLGHINFYNTFTILKQERTLERYSHIPSSTPLSMDYIQTSQI